MSFKIFYYIIGMIIIFREISHLINLKQHSYDAFDFLMWFRRKKEEWGYKPEWRDYTPEIKEFAKPLMVWAVIIFSWLLLGLATFNWMVIVLYFVIVVPILKAWYKKIETRESYMIHTLVAKLILIGTILFMIINSFHLHISLQQFIFGG